MDEQGFNMSMRKFLKVVGVTSQHEIERLVQDNEKGELRVRMVLTAEGRPLEHIIEGTIESRANRLRAT
jgi:metal-sulfur cluster biosynthetic enzyme